VQDIGGTWDGFFQGADDPEIVRVRLEITGQDKRRFEGTLEAGGAKHIIEGAVSANGNVKFQGHASHSHGLGRMELHDFGGGAAILNGNLMLHFADGRMIDGPLLLLRPFTPAGDDVAPVLASGVYRASLYVFGAGSGKSLIEDLQFRAPNLMLFTGTLDPEFVLFGQATINGDGRFIAVARATAGYLILNGTWQYLPQSDKLLIITGSSSLELNDGTVREGTFELALERE
jgi:hypothetical protein